MKLSAQYECGAALKALDDNTMTVAERIAVAQVLATLAVAEATDALANAIWSTETTKNQGSDETDGE